MPNLRLAPTKGNYYYIERNGVEGWYVNEAFYQWEEALIYEDGWDMGCNDLTLENSPVAIPSPFILWSK